MSKQRATQLVEAAVWLQATGDQDGAFRLFEQALKLDPDNTRARDALTRHTVRQVRVSPPVVLSLAAPPEAAVEEVMLEVLESDAVAPPPPPKPVEPPIAPPPLAIAPAPVAVAPAPAAAVAAPLSVAPSPVPPKPAPPPPAQPPPAVASTPASLPSHALTPSPPPFVSAALEMDWGSSLMGEAQAPSPAAAPQAAVAAPTPPIEERHPVTLRFMAPPPAATPAVVPQAVVPQAVVPQAVVPQAVVPQAVVPQAVVPQAVVPQAIAVAPTTAWESDGRPAIEVAPPAATTTSGPRDVMDLLGDARSKPTPVPMRRPTEIKQEVDALVRGARDLLELDDHSGAMDLIQKAAELAPEDAVVKRLKEKSEVVLQSMYESKLGSLEARPRVVLRPDEIIWLNLDHRAGFVLAQIDGSVTFDDLFAICGMSRLDTLRILAQLSQAGVIAPSRN